MNTDPYLDVTMRGWIVNMARRNCGRIANHDMEDLIQEGYLCYYKCRNRYVGKVGLHHRDGRPCRFLPETNPDNKALRHFQALVCTTFSNVLSTLATKQPRGREKTITDLCVGEQTTEQAWDALLPADAELATVTVLLKTAPKEIKQLFDLLISDALDLSRYRRFGRKRRSQRETNNQYFRRLLKLPPGFNIVELVNEHFSA